MQLKNFRSLDAEILGHDNDPTIGENEMLLLGNLVRALTRASRWIFLAALVGGVLAYFATFLTPVKYTSEAQVMINTRVSVDTVYTPVVSDLPTSTTVLESELEVLRSYDLIERIVDQLNLQDDPEFQDDAELGFSLSPAALIGAVKSGLKSVFIDAEPTAGGIGENSKREMTIDRVASQRSVEQVGNVSAVYVIRFTSIDRDKAAALANALAAEYLNVQTEAKLRSLELSQGWLSTRTQEIQQELSDLGVQLEQHFLDAPYSSEEIQLIKVRRVSAERRMQEYQESISALNATLQVLESQGASQAELLFAAESIPNPSAGLEAAIAAAKSDDPGADDILKDALAANYQSLTTQRDRLTEDIENFQPELDLLRTNLAEQAKWDSETHRIENGILVLEAIYQDFLTQLSRRTQQGQYLDADARIISYARPPLDPSEPGRAQAAIAGAIILALVAVGLTILRELKQSRLRTAQEITAITGLRVLGIIPESKSNESIHETFLSHTNNMEQKLTRFTRKIHSSLSFELNRLHDGLAPKGRTEIGKEIDRQNQSRIIAGTSTVVNEGQSTAMLFLANAFANAGERVLLIDCDFWNSPYTNLEPWGNHYFGKFLAEPQLTDSCIVEIGDSGLHFLPSAQYDDNTSALLGTPEFARLLDYLATKYDRILLDTPPLLSMIDSAPICKQADEVILFVRWHSTSRSAVKSALQLLHDTGVTPLAAVATRMNLRRARRFGDNSLLHMNKSHLPQ